MQEQSATLDLVLAELTHKLQVCSNLLQPSPERLDVLVLVGIHARGDMKDSDVYNPGDAYFQEAIDQMRSEIRQRALGGGDNAPRIKFLVFSEGDEGRNWFESNHEGGGIFSPLEDFQYVGSDDAMLDLAVLSSCDHNIISGGTYSFWSALLGRKNGDDRLVITSNDNYGLPGGWQLMAGRDDRAEISSA